MPQQNFRFVAATIIMLVLVGAFPTSAQDEVEPVVDEPRPGLTIEWKQVVGRDDRVQLGQFRVYENRTAEEGRMIELKVMVLPAQCPDEEKARDPVFYLAGGPGQGAADLFAGFLNHPLRRNRDIVLVNQRGTGGDNHLQCAVEGNDDDLQSYFSPLFQPERIRACMGELQKRSDLRYYGTPDAMDDLNDVRVALGYEQINLVGGSYGTRASLVYMRQHPETVRTAVLNGVAPIAFRNPLYHARSAQDMLNEIFKIVGEDPEYRKAFPRLRTKFAAVMKRLAKGPVDATIMHPRTNEPVAVQLDHNAMAGALRIAMYYQHRDVPLIIQQAFDGDYDRLAQRGFDVARGLRHQLALGMLLCVTCAEDLARIDPGEIHGMTVNTFLGDGRVRSQMEVCKFWPKSNLPDDYGQPVSVNVPVLVLSGTLDPVTPPKWGAEAASHLENSLHLVVPGSHGVGGPCVQSIIDQFLEQGSVDAVDTTCTDQMVLPRFTLPEINQQQGEIG